MKIILLSLLCFSTLSLAANKRTYKGIAKDKKGNVVYLEAHDVTLDKKDNVQKTISRYKSSKGKLLGVIKSDYTKNLTCPEHSFQNYRDGSSHGVRLKGKKAILFAKEKNEKEKTKEIDLTKFDKSALVVGSQGLHYYLVKNLAKVAKMDELSLKFLIPGKLDYYSFYLTTEKETKEYVDFKIRIDNFFLSLFAPSLEMRYEKKTGHLLSYSGLSNLPDDEGEMQSVSITYQY